ncbi:MAG: ABC transporter substrate-binding protein [Nocardioidaceae bacterium]
MASPTRTSFSRVARGAVALAAVASLTGCGLVGASESQLDTVVVGSANFTESALLGEIYAQALESHDIPVERQFNIGNREAYMKSIEGDNPSINILPEYLGYLLEYYQKDIPDMSVDAVKAQLQRELPEQLEILDISQATDEDAIVVTQQTAAKYDLQTIGDLAPVADQFVAGGSPEFRTRRAGVAGMRDVYGVEFQGYKTLDTAGPLSLEALLNNQIQVSDFFTTQSVIQENDLVILKDPKGILPPGNIVPVIRDDVPERDQVEESLNAISAALTTQKLTEMVRRVDVEKEPLETVAEDFLTQEGPV